MEPKMTREDFLKASGGALGLSCLAVAGVPGSALAAPAGDSDWKKATEILRRVKGRVNPPDFPNRDFPITDYGAVGDGKTDSTGAFQRAVAECTGSGGGRVVVPAGAFLTGAIHLKDNVNLHVTSDATIEFSRDPKDYLPVVYTRWQGIELYNYSAFIYAYGRKNVAVTGTGTIDGRASKEYWWPWKGEPEDGWKPGEPSQDEADDRSVALAEQGVPVEDRVFGEGSYLRPNLIQFYRCQNLLIEGVTLKNSPMWHMHPVLSTNVTIQGVTVDSPVGPNSDGCDPECCSYVYIKDCYFNCGDDDVAMKSGKNADGRRVDTPTSYVLVEGCEMKDGHGAITMGSEMTGGVENVLARNNRVGSPNLNQVLRIKTNSMRGGYVRNIYVRNTTVSQAADAAVKINFYYGDGEGAGSYYPDVRYVYVRNTRVQNANRALDIRGYEDDPIHTVHLKNCVFEKVDKENRIENVEGLVLSNVVIGGKRYKTSAKSAKTKASR